MPNLSPAIILSRSIAVARRHFSTKPKLPSLSNVPSKRRRQAIQQAKLALTDYLHSTRSLPFSYAHHIVNNSQFAVAHFVSQLEFSAPSFPQALQKFLRYHPINEFEFFFESIGIDHGEVKPNVFFLSEDPRVFDAACLLCGFGFPWNKLGVLYKGDASIFSSSSDFLRSRLEGFKALGFGSFPVVGICLAFPHLLTGEDELGGQLVSDLRKLLIDFDLQSFVEGEVDACYEICRKVRVFYELGVEIGKVEEAMRGNCKTIFMEHPEDVLIEKVGFFSRLGISKLDVGSLLLEKPELLSIDLETPTISVSGILRHFGAEEKQLRLIKENYPYILGRNKMGNLPHALRAMDLHEWFFNKIKDGNHRLLASYALSNPDEGVDKNYLKCLQKTRAIRTHAHIMGKLNFLHSVGFAENGYAAKALADTHGSFSEVQERFDCLLAAGIGFSKLCKMLTVFPKMLNQDSRILKQKVNFLRHELGLPLDVLYNFPGYFCFDLERRIKPRCRFHFWLEEQGLCDRKYSLGSIVATSEKNFMARLRLIHPTAPTLWYEHLACKNDENDSQERSVSHGL